MSRDQKLKIITYKVDVLAHAKPVYPVIITAGLNTTALGAACGHPCTATTSTIVYSIPSGGTPGYTYSWSYVSGDAVTTVSNSTASSVTFSRISPSAGTFVSVWKCTVTDSASHTGTQNVTITMSIG